LKILFHFSVIGFSNSYIIGNDNGDAILIDPGHMDLQLLDIIESNHYYIKHILITHRHKSHTHGIETLLRIYDAEVYAFSSFGIYDFPVHALSDGEIITLSGIAVECRLVPGHSADSLVFIIDKSIFTGDVLLSGRIGKTDSELSQSLLLRSIKKKILPLDDRMLIFPGHGAPTTLKIEKLFNQNLIEQMRHDGL